MHQILLQRFQHEVEGTQAEDCEHHGAVDNQRLAADGNDRGNGVEGEHHVGQLYHRHAEQQRRRVALRLLHTTYHHILVFRLLQLGVHLFLGQDKRVAADFWPDRIEAFYQAVRQMVGVILDFITLFIAFQHHHRGPADDQRKNHLNVWPQAEQAGADGNKNTAEHNRPQHAPVEHAVTILIRHAEPGEDRHHHKQVVDGEHLFQCIAGEEQTGHLRAVVHV